MVMYFFSFCCALSVLYLFFFFFKQKTAYEMRISDWSSDVCSSDLHNRAGAAHKARPLPRASSGRSVRATWDWYRTSAHRPWWFSFLANRKWNISGTLSRSEEHTSELQSLMRISYAVFCLKKKNNKKYKIET